MCNEFINENECISIYVDLGSRVGVTHNHTTTHLSTHKDAKTHKLCLDVC